VLLLATLGGGLLSVRRAAEDALAHARELAAASWARVEPRPETPVERLVRLWTPERDVRALFLEEDGSLLVGTSGGAFRYDPVRGRAQPIPVPRGLASSAVRAVAPLGGGFALGMEDGGVAWLHGRRDLVVPPIADGGRVRAMAPYAGGLAVGTAQGRLWWLGPDGASRLGLPGEATALEEVRATASSPGQLLLAGAGGELLWLRGDARARGQLAGETPMAAALSGARAWVGTELGLWTWEPGKVPERIEVGAVVTALAADEDGAWVGAADGRVLRVAHTGATRVEARLDAAVRALARSPEALFLGGAFGLVHLDPGRGEVGRLVPRGLSAGHVTALAPAPEGRVWVGTFDGGLELLDPGTGAVEARHREVDLWQVNALVPAAPGHPLPGLLVATSRGLFTEDPPGRFRRVPVGDSGEGSPRYQAVVRHLDGVAVAGKDGVRLRDATGEVRALGSFHGLPSNKAYALLPQGEQLFVGTLGGLARLDDGRLARTWRPESSALPAGWVQALGVAPSGLFLGTFGGGVAWMRAGELAVTPVPGTPPDISPGALAVHGGRVLVGSAAHGVAVLDTGGRFLGTFTDGLPSHEVSALLADDAGVWVGTSRGLARVPWETLATFLR
jgi:ligand-binding sensor domain-containing protein